MPKTSPVSSQTPSTSLPTVQASACTSSSSRSGFPEETPAPPFSLKRAALAASIPPIPRKRIYKKKKNAPTEEQIQETKARLLAGKILAKTKQFIEEHGSRPLASLKTIEKLGEAHELLSRYTKKPEKEETKSSSGSSSSELTGDLSSAQYLIHYQPTHIVLYPPSGADQPPPHNPYEPQLPPMLPLSPPQPLEQIVGSISSPLPSPSSPHFDSFSHLSQLPISHEDLTHSPFCPRAPSPTPASTWREAPPIPSKSAASPSPTDLQRRKAEYQSRLMHMFQTST